ncbi:MAG: enoyl-CoA hydratase-related protein [Fimbriimonas sp.]
MLDVESKGPIKSISINRPDVKNAFNDRLIEALHEAFREISSETRAVVLSGRGDAFCAGGDLNWMKRAATYSVEQNAEDALRLAHLYESIQNCPVPVIARVQGHAFGGALGLIAASDIAIAADNALFAFSEVNLGLLPATISPFVLRKIGEGHARALFTTGERFGADHALRIGLVHEVTTLDGLDAAVNAKLKRLLAAGPVAVRQSKALALGGPISLEAASQLLADARSSAEGREGVSAFLEKRKASFAQEL